jgi:hypothetical protein
VRMAQALIQGLTSEEMMMSRKEEGGILLELVVVLPNFLMEVLENHSRLIICSCSMYYLVSGSPHPTDELPAKFYEAR